METIVSTATQPAQKPVAMLVMTCFVLERDSRRHCNTLVVFAHAEPNHDTDHEARHEHVAAEYQNSHFNAPCDLPRLRSQNDPAIGGMRLPRRARSSLRAPPAPTRSSRPN